VTIGKFESYISSVLFLTIPAALVPPLLELCRRQLEITLTGLLHSLILIYLAKSVSAAQGFRAVTPYSLRNFTGLSSEEIANHISYILTTWDSTLVSSARVVSENSEEENKLIQLVSKQFRNELSRELDGVPTRGPYML